MKNFLPIIAILFVANFASAQEEAVFGHYIFNPVLVNPAASGFDAGHHNIFMNIRSAWASFPGAPKTYALSYNGPLGKRLGIGGMMFSENVASITAYRAQLSFAFRYDISDVKFAAGFAAQFNRMRVQNDALSAPIFDQGDDVLMSAVDGEKVFDASLGLYGTYKDDVFFGLSFPSLIRTRLDAIEGTTDQGTGPQFFTLQVGGNFNADEYKIKLQPSILVKRLRSVPFQVDFNLLASFLQERLITGLSYTHGAGGNLGIMLGTKYNALRFVYSYGIYLDEFQKYNGGTHEITINFEFVRSEGKFDRSKKYRK